ncbi:MAG: sialate O-acetylesterase [Lentisphaeria bacterium]
MKLASLFLDNAIIQRNMPIPVWGITEPDSFIECSIDKTNAFGASSSSGTFMLQLPSLEAGGPYTLRVINKTHGDECIIMNVMVGEVWLASGQSNMEFPMKNSPEQFTDYQNNNPDPSMIRMITVPQLGSSVSQDYFKAQWLDSTNENIPYFSAAALWFAKKIYKELHVAVGIINASWGGTIIESWTSRNTLLQNPDLCKAVLENDQKNNLYSAWQDVQLSRIRLQEKQEFDQSEYLHQYCIPDSGPDKNSQNWPCPKFCDHDWKEMTVPGDWIQQKIGPHGVAWFRKEVSIPQEWNNCELFLNFCGIDKQDTAYFNGEPIGTTGTGLETDFWNISRHYKIPAKLVKSGKAVIAFRVYSFAFGAGFNGSPEACSLSSANSASSISLAGIWKARIEKEILAPPPIEEYPETGPGNPNTFSALFNTMIRPLIPYSIKGVLWNQGEANAKTIEDAKKYQKKMTDLIQDWRFYWQQTKLPFIQTIITGFSEKYEYDPDDGWPFLRDSQRKCAEMLKDVYSISAVDLGEIENIHAKDKRSIGYRFAQCVLVNIYGKTGMLPSGPEFITAKRENSTLRLFFRYSEGLHTAGDPLVGFFLAGIDKKFYRASAQIEGNSVIVSRKNITSPCYVRYAWSRNPIANLVNREGLPALPFEGFVLE